MYDQLLKQHKLSITQHRKTILKTLASINYPVTIDELSKKIPTDINQTTLYRSLRALVDVGLIYQTDFHEGVSYYEFQGEDHHHHITCTKCKKRESVNLCFKKGIAGVATKKSFTITNHIFELFGLCKNCL